MTMGNLMRAQWFRLAHSWLGYGCLACFVALTLLVAMSSMDVRFMNEGYLPGREALPLFECYSGAFLTLGFVPIVAGFFVSGLVAGDLGGTAKNLVQGPGARLAYGGAALLFGLLACALFVALGMVCVEVVAWARGIPLAVPAAGARLVWFVQATLCSAAYVALTCAVAMATGSRMLGMVTALVLGLGVAGTAAAVVLEGAGVAVPSEGRFVPGSLSWWTAQLANGPLEGWGWLACAAAVGALGAGATLLAARRRGLD